MLTMRVDLERFNLATVRAILILAHDPRYTQEIRRLALKICHGARTRHEQARRIFYWVKKNMRYVRDPTYREFVQEPYWLLRRVGTTDMAGDCDDFSVLLGALLSSVNIPFEIVLAEDHRQRGLGKPVWSHVYARALTEKGIIPVDASMWFLDFGEEVPGRKEAHRAEEVPHEQLTGGMSAVRQLGKIEHLGAAADVVGQVITSGAQIATGRIGYLTQQQMLQAQQDAIQQIGAQQAKKAEIETSLAQKRLDLFNVTKMIDDYHATGNWRVFAPAGMALAGVAGLFFIVHKLTGTK